MKSITFVDSYERVDVMLKAMNPLRYPIGIQTFSKMREEGYLYVDKTDLVYEMANGNASYVFLSRPRRFGKSLLVSTLKAYFEGRKDLFEGLAMEALETEWTKYAVLHFSMSTAKNLSKEGLESELNVKLREYERLYGRNEEDVAPNQRLQGLVKRAYEQTGQKVVVLIDEYDAPLLDVVKEEENLPILRNVMRNFYSPLKDLDPYLRFVFITGITKFSQLSIFSELNNIKNFSMDEQYASICGITEEEMLTQMRLGIEQMAQKEEMTYEEAVEQLKMTYDGYHFTWPSPDIYNPYSLLNALNDRKIESYWFGSGTPTYLIEMLRKFDVAAEKIGGEYVSASQFDAPTETMTSAIPLLYQSGYLTIKGYNRKTKDYLLDIPNREVRRGLMNSLLPEYVTPALSDEGFSTAKQLYLAIDEGRIEDAIVLLKNFLSRIPYTGNTNYEGHYQSVLCIIFNLIGFSNVDIEVRTPQGRVDMVVRTADHIYLFEVKFNKSAREAMEQINSMNYAERFAHYTLPIVKVALNFDGASRNISEYLIEEEK